MTLNGIARHVGVIKKNPRSQHNDNVICGQLIRQWLLGRKQASSK